MHSSQKQYVNLHVFFMNNANNDKMFSFVSHKQPVKSGEKFPYSQHYFYHDVDRHENARIVQRLNVEFHNYF